MYTFEYIIISPDFNYQKDIISIADVAIITTASITLTKVNTFFENRLSLYSLYAKKRVSTENIITIKYNHIIQSHSLLKLKLVYFLSLISNEVPNNTTIIMT